MSTTDDRVARPATGAAPSPATAEAAAPQAGAQGAARRRRLRPGQVALAVALPLIAIALWQVAVWVFAPREWILPSPVDVARAGWDARDRLWFHMQWTILIAVIGLALANFRAAPLRQNIPMLMGLLGVWHRNVLGRAAHAVIPYDQRLARFPAYLQQLDMESNGKSVTRAGAPVAGPTGPIVFGEPGTNGQHAFFQLLHQGTDVVPIDFLVAAQPIGADPHHHALLFSNCLAQAEAFMRGRTLAESRAQLEALGLSAAEVEALAPHRVFAGDRPSSVFLYKRLDPRTLGRLVALYEHKVFVQAAIWDINPFDQWGVELGKELANRLGPIVEDPTTDTGDLDSSTAGLIAWRRARDA